MPKMGAMDTTQPTHRTITDARELTPADLENFVQVTASLIVADVRAGKVAADALTPSVVRGYVVAAYERHTRLVDAVANGVSALRQGDPLWQIIARHLHSALRTGQVAA